MDEIFNTSTIIIFELIQCKVVKRMLVRNARIHPIRGVSTILTKKAGFLKLLIFHNFNASFQLKIHQLCYYFVKNSILTQKLYIGLKICFPVLVKSLVVELSNTMIGISD